MAISRKDSRGYALKTGECQRSDGRYSYAYTDKEGKRHTVYASSLADLRKRERQIVRDIEDGIDAHAPEKVTLNQLFDKYFSQKYDLKPTTRANYKYCFDRYVRESFGKRKITDIKYTDVKAYYYSIIQDRCLSSATLDNIHTTLHPTFQMGVRDGLLRINPTDGVMAEIKKSRFWDKPKRRSLTIPQQKELTEFLKNNREFHGWAPVIIILLGTGMRIGECMGLRWDDLDFEKRMISVNHNLTDRPYEDGKFARHIQTPKTRARSSFDDQKRRNCNDVPLSFGLGTYSNKTSVCVRLNPQKSV